MSAIILPTVIDATIKTICQQTVAEVVTVLAAKHGFDADAAMLDLNLEDMKVVRKSTSPPKVARTKTAKSKAAASDEDKPKRPKTGYQLFSDAARSATMATLKQDLAEGEKMPKGALMSALGALWKGLIEDERAEWNVKAKSPPPSDDETNPEVAAVPAPNPRLRFLHQRRRP